MNSQNFLPLFMLLVLIGGLIILFTSYFLAVRESNKSKSYERELPDLIDEFHELEKQLQALKPFCRTNPRLFLYSEIDNRINTSYKKAEQEIRAGLSINKNIAIHKIDMPPILPGFIRFNENLEKLGLGEENQKEIDKLRRHLQDAKSAIADINQAIDTEKKTNTDIENELQRHLRELTQREVELSAIQAKLGGQDYQRLKKSIASIRNQLDSAQQTLQTAINDRNLNFARTFVLLTGVDQLIRLYDLDFQIAKVPFNYVLDISPAQVANSTAELNDKLCDLFTLDYKELPRKDEELKNQDKNTKQVETVFKKFISDCDTYQARQKAVCETKLEIDIQEAQKAEKEGVDCWGNTSESPAKWDPLLEGKGLPSTRLQRIAESQKRYCPNQAGSLKQSELAQTIVALDSILTDVEAVRKTTKEIRKAVDEQLWQTRERIEILSGQIEGLEKEFLSLSPRFPTVNRTWEDITKIFDNIQNEYRMIGGSYKRMAAYENSAVQTIILLTTIKEEFETDKKKFDKDCDDLTKEIQSDRKSSNDEVEPIYRTDWRIPLSLEINSAKDLLGIYDVLLNEADRIRTKPIRDIPESIGRCREEKLKLRVKILEKFTSINKLIWELDAALKDLQNRLEREIRNGISDTKQSQIRELMEQAKKAYSPDAARRKLTDDPNRIF